MYALNLSDDGRVLSATKPEYAPPDAVTVEVLPDGDISLYRFVDGELVRDANLVAEALRQEVSRQIDELTAQLRATDTTVLEALEGLLSCTTLEGFLSAVLTAAGSLKETMDARAALRAEILQKQGGMTDASD